MIDRRRPCGLGVLLLAGPALVGQACRPGEQPADLVLTSGTVITVDDRDTTAQALAVRAGRIVFVGDPAGARRFVGPSTEVIDLEGATAIPGFIEGHGHFYGLGESRLILDLRAAATWEDMVAQVAEAATTTPAGEWIVGRGWHQAKWAVAPEPAYDGVPTHHALSAAAPEHPVTLEHASGHASLVNELALALAGIDPHTPDPPGGTIVRDAAGAATGYLRETAQDLVERARWGARGSNFDEARARRVVELAGEECLRKGITSFQDAGSPIELVDFYRRLADEGALPVRLWVMLRDTNDALRRELGRLRVVDHADGQLTVRAIKHSVDGALGSHGAWLLAPYADLPQSTGLVTTPLGVIEESARLAVEHDLQLCVHAIGDRANREILDLFERALGEGSAARRWRIEHAQHLHPDDVPRFASLGVIASMQGVHCTSDGPWVPDRLGAERSRGGAYVWRALLDRGAVVSNGTDAPVEDVDPLRSFYASVTRRLADGSAFYPEQAMTRREALRSYTRDAAFAAFEENEKGTLETGKRADITVLSHNPLEVPEEQLLATFVRYTIVGGRVAYRAADQGGGGAR